MAKKAKRKSKPKVRRTPSRESLWTRKDLFEDEAPETNAEVETPSSAKTERELFISSAEEFQDAYQTLKKRGQELGEQRIYTSARAVMFSRRVCYMFVRPKKTYVELCFFLPRKERHSLIHRVDEVSKTKFSHTVKLTHSDQVEEPLTDWLKEAFELAK